MFVSTFVNKLDKKGRVSVPAPFRATLMTESFQGIVLFRSLRLNALEGCGISRLQLLSQSLDRQDFFSSSYNDLADCLFAEAEMLSFDSEGRVSLSESFLAFLGVTDQVAFVGRGAMFQVWEPQKFRAHQDAARARLMETPVSLNLNVTGDSQ